jgi:hypothetical protein
VVCGVVYGARGCACACCAWLRVLRVVARVARGCVWDDGCGTVRSASSSEDIVYY